jgi:hypothetical protein
MKLEIYEPNLVGYVSLNPYEWEYNGKYEDIAYFLARNIQPTESGSYINDEGAIVEVENEITDEKQKLIRISSHLKSGGVWHTKIVNE